MTGTAKTEEKEFTVEIYRLHVVEIPTNVAVARADQNDFIFKTKEAKYNAVIEDIKERHEAGRRGARRPRSRSRSPSTSRGSSAPASRTTS